MGWGASAPSPNGDPPSCSRSAKELGPRWSGDGRTGECFTVTVGDPAPCLSVGERAGEPNNGGPANAPP